ncbi:MAG: alpha-galactosidase [Clostridia bacterium]|nr:alpha-galactosidase [Clostridia bacterium]
MAISYDKEQKLFHLQTPNTSYVMGVCEDTHLLHLYYGAKIKSYSVVMENFPIREHRSFECEDISIGAYSTGTLPLEYPVYGHGDYRSPAFHAEYCDGSHITALTYQGYEIKKGKTPLKGLPATYTESDDEAETLYITLMDQLTGLSLILSYTVFEDSDAIVKSVLVKNGGSSSIYLKTVMSSCIHLFDKDYDFVHLEGTWARERSIQKRPLMTGTMSIDSKRTTSSHHHSPFLALARPYATETCGDVYAMSFVYSGNHIETTEVDAFDTTRAMVGINPFGFGWNLNPGEEFQAPEVVLTYSATGFGAMSRTYHKLYRTRLCRGKFRDLERPVLINNWEATYFGFNEEKILRIAEKAKTVGVELMVLDDGWFGKRDSDNCSLGDWVVDKRKLPNGIEGLASKVTELGMQFGLWFEPEMVSEDSDLYRAHPDWCLHVKDRRRTPSRFQLILDMSRPEVRDYVVDAVSSVLSSAPISYVKWDMNRNASEVGSAGYPESQQSEISHRYILGVYEILERLTSAFPDILFEGCSGGGGRFDAGMLYYFPQYWTSDDSDALERLYIQHGTSMVMPACTMGAHVSAVPNHQVRRTTPLKARGDVASVGQLGYELDLNTLSEEEIQAVKAQIIKYKELRHTVHYGEMYRLKSPFDDRCCAWEYVTENQIVLMYCVAHARVGLGRTCVKLEGLDPDAKYRDKESGVVYDGDYLMHVGLYFTDKADLESQLLIFDRV